MYNREYVWQDSIITSNSESGWENTIILGFPGIDVRFKLIGYGWKTDIDTENESVLYSGKYTCYYREVGEESWVYFTTVISERADQSESNVYKKCFVQIGVISEKTYEIKILAADGEKYQAWEDSGDGVVEGVNSGDVFWENVKLRGVIPIRLLPYESISIEEDLNAGVDTISLVINETLTLLDYFDDWKIILLISAAVDETSIIEYINIYLAWSYFVYDNINLTEDAEVFIGEFDLSVYDDTGIREAVFDQEPTNLLFLLEHQYVSEDIVFDLTVSIDNYSNVTVSEDVYAIFSGDYDTYEVINLQENITTYLDILFSEAYDEINIVEYPIIIRVIFFESLENISVIENINAMKIYLFFINNSAVVAEYVDMMKVYLVLIDDEIVLTENIVNYLDVLVPSIHTEITISENLDNYLDVLVPENYENINAFYSNNYKLLLSFENDFRDLANDYYPNAISTPSLTSFHKKFGNYSVYFGSWKYISYSPIDDFEPFKYANGNYTIDFWTKLPVPEISASGYVCSGGVSDYWTFRRDYSDRLNFNFLNTIIQVSSTNIDDGNWHHLALIKKGYYYGIYLNGQQIGYKYTENSGVVGGEFVIGNWLAAARNNSWNGYIDEFRMMRNNFFDADPDSGNTDTIVVPTAAALSPPLDVIENIYLDELFLNAFDLSSIVENINTWPLLEAFLTITLTEDITNSLDVLVPEINEEIFGDSSPFDPNYKLLLHAENSINDSSIQGHVPSSSSLFYGTGVNKKWGNHSFLFQPVNNHSIVYANSNDWNFFGNLTEDWTVDLWVKHLSFGNPQYYCCHFVATDERWMFYLATDSSLRLYYIKNSVVCNCDGGTITDNDWHHVAAIKQGNKVGVYLDGIQIAYAPVLGTAIFNGNFGIGCIPPISNIMDGYIDEFRITKNNFFNANPCIGKTDTIIVPTKMEIFLDGIENICLDVLNFNIFDSSSIIENINLGVS